MPTEPGRATQQASMAATAASTALPPASRISRPALAADGWGVATAAVFGPNCGGIVGLESGLVGDCEKVNHVSHPFHRRPGVVLGGRRSRGRGSAAEHCADQ